MPFFKAFSRFSQLFHTGRTYLDIASSTPVDFRMLRTIPKIPADVLAANPNALHREGVALQTALREARERVASVLDAHADEIIFTSGATESDNLAIVGTLYQWITDGIDPNDIVVFSSELEHAAVAETLEQFVRMGAQHNIFPATNEAKCGIVDPKHIIVPETAKAVFITVMMVSNEIGVVQPIAEIAKRVRKLRKLRPELQIVLHTDATQAPAHQLLRIPSLGVDLLTLGATKLYCRKGVGLLYKKRSIKLMPIMRGGGQEYGLRPGTEPVELIHEFSYALQYAQEHREEQTEHAAELQRQFETELKRRFPQLRITAEKLPRSPHITHVGVPHSSGIADSELLVLELDARGIAVSAKSACKNEEGSESPIVEKLYGKDYSAVRFSFGRMTAKRDIDRTLKALAAIFKKYTGIS